MSVKFYSISSAVAIVVAASVVLMINGCGGGGEVAKNARDPEPKVETTGGAATAPVAVAKNPKPAGGGEAFDKAMAKGVIKGVVSFEGKPQKMPMIDVSEKVCKEHHGDKPLKEERLVVSDDGKVANVVVFVTKGFEKYNFDNYQLPAALINQEGCQYLPHVLAMKTGQTLEIQSSDPVTHNVHIISQYNGENNISQPSKGIHSTKPKFENAELGIKVKCDVHGWMQAWICAFDHPFFAVTKADGTFEINVPPGEYTITTWQEQLSSKKVIASAPVTVKVEADKPAEANFTYKMK